MQEDEIKALAKKGDRQVGSFWLRSKEHGRTVLRERPFGPLLSTYLHLCSGMLLWPATVLGTVLETVLRPFSCSKRLLSSCI